MCSACKAISTLMGYNVCVDLPLDFTYTVTAVIVPMLLLLNSKSSYAPSVLDFFIYLL